jgi:hypothetical protein
MSNRNDENAAMGVAVAAIGFAFMFFFALLAFAALVWTILSIFAWNKPLKLGPIDIQPHEARRFVGRGIVGMAIIPAFAIFCVMLFDLRIDWSFWWSYLLIGGYTAGSVGIEILADDDDETIVATPATPPSPMITRPQRYMDMREPPSHRFAKWDDGEKSA